MNPQLRHVHLEVRHIADTIHHVKEDKSAAFHFPLLVHCIKGGSVCACDITDRRSVEMRKQKKLVDVLRCD